MGYDPTPTEKEIFDELRSADEKLTAQEIAEGVSSKPNYVRECCNSMAEAGVIGKKEGNIIIGLEIPSRDDPVVLANREVAEDIINESSKSPAEPVDEIDLDELRAFIEDQIATDRFPLNVTRNHYYYDESVHEGL